ncbi:MAG: HupE/UreJ family protein [Cyanobacteriota bacterium]|nr:HupE/UreJ family protein [Cyanobacteriota bacterium]
MTFPTLRRGLTLLPLLLLAGSPALAHGTASGGLGAGVLHPLLGFDHLLLLIAVGASSACLSPRVLLWAAAGALLGAVGGAAGGSMPAAESLAALAIALVALPLLARHPQRWQAVAGVPLAGAVAVHALLHGQEAPAGGAAPLWWLGALLASLLVIGLAGVAVRQLPSRGRVALGLALVTLGGALAVVPALAPALAPVAG